MMRLRGGVLVLCGVALGGFGLWLLYLAMGWPYPAFVPPDLVPSVHAPDGTPLQRILSVAGLAAMFLATMGGVSAVLGLGMLILGRRNGVVFNILLALFAIFAMIVAGVALAGWT